MRESGLVVAPSVQVSVPCLHAPAQTGNEFVYFHQQTAAFAQNEIVFPALLSKAQSTKSVSCLFSNDLRLDLYHHMQIRLSLPD